MRMIEDGKSESRHSRFEESVDLLVSLAYRSFCMSC